MAPSGVPGGWAMAGVATSIIAASATSDANKIIFLIKLLSFFSSRFFRDSSLSRTAESSSSDSSSRPVVDRFPFCHAGCRRLLILGRTSGMCAKTFCTKTYQNALSVSLSAKREGGD